jgi:hypothetical protein
MLAITSFAKLGDREREEKRKRLKIIDIYKLKLSEDKTREGFS